MAEVVAAVVEARRGGGGTKGAYALAYAVVRRWWMESMGFQSELPHRRVSDLCWHTRTVSQFPVERFVRAGSNVGGKRSWWKAM